MSWGNWVPNATVAPHDADTRDQTLEQVTSILLY